MSKKSHGSLNDLDKILRQNFPAGMTEGTQLTIRKICGFEIFGHTDTWADGYVIENDYITANSEDLDDAVENFVTAYALYKQGYINKNNWVYLPENHNRVVAKIKGS